VSEQYGSAINERLCRMTEGATWGSGAFRSIGKAVAARGHDPGTLGFLRCVQCE